MSSILVVDDKDSIRKMLSETLRSEGHDVEVAKTGHTAVEKARNGRFDLVLTDSDIPMQQQLPIHSLVTTVRRCTRGSVPTF